MDGLQASFSDGENLPVNTTTERKPSQEEVQPRPMQNKPDSELGSEKCVDLHVSRPIYKWPIIVEKQVLLQTEACKSSEIDNENEVLAKSASGLSKSTQHFGTEPGSLEEPSVIESLRYIGKGAQIASGDGYGSQLLAQSGESGAKCSRSGLVLAEKKSPINGPNLPYGAPVMTKVVPKFGRRRF
uniref:Uncharacterized protein n=1 Tax=Parascaris univalens TaxID=6257 RepID=A0A915A375_PARUN